MRDFGTIYNELSQRRNRHEGSLNLSAYRLRDAFYLDTLRKVNKNEILIPIYEVGQNEDKAYSAAWPGGKQHLQR